MAKLTLAEQMLKAGLVNQKKVKKTAKSSKKSRALKKEIKEATEQAKLNKQQKDNELNQQQKNEQYQKEIFAQIKQLIKTNAQNREDGEETYQFNHDGKIKTIYLTEKLKKDVIDGRLAIVSIEDDLYELIPVIVATKIAQRDEKYIVLINDKSLDIIDEDDPYAEFQIPDDLMW